MLTKLLIHPKVFFKATMLFFSANALNLSLHELSHAMTAYFLKVPAILFHFYVDINHNEATDSDQVAIALAGPVFSLFVGVLSWIFYHKSTTITGRLFLLYAAIFGISIFLGNLFSTAFAGDFNKVTKLLLYSSSLRYFISGVGLVALITFTFIAGREFLNIPLFESGQKKSAVINGLIIPCLLGTALLILAYTPLPAHFVRGIIVSSVFWGVSILGATTRKPTAKSIHFPSVSLNAMDIVLFLTSLLVVRILAAGIHFNP